MQLATRSQLKLKTKMMAEHCGQVMSLWDSSRGQRAECKSGLKARRGGHIIERKPHMRKPKTENRIKLQRSRGGARTRIAKPGRLRRALALLSSLLASSSCSSLASIVPALGAGRAC